MHTLRQMHARAADSAPQRRSPERAPDAPTTTPAPHPRMSMTDAEAVAVHTARVLADGARELASHDVEDEGTTLSPAAMMARWHQRGLSLQQAVVEALQADRVR